MRSAIVLLMMLGMGLSALGQQFPSERYHLGSVTLNDGTVLTGRIKYDLDADVILLVENENSKVATISANQFRSFFINSASGKGLRKFYSVPVVNQTGYKRPMIFELIQEGGKSLVAREYIATRTRTSSRSSFRRSIHDPFYDPFNTTYAYRYLAYNLWLIDENAELSQVGNTRNEVLRAFEDHQTELRKYIKREKLRMDRLEDLTKLVVYYNELNSPEN